MPSSNDRKISQLPLLTELKEDTIFLVVSDVGATPKNERMLAQTLFDQIPSTLTIGQELNGKDVTFNTTLDATNRLHFDSMTGNLSLGHDLHVANSVHIVQDLYCSGNVHFDSFTPNFANLELSGDFLCGNDAAVGNNLTVLQDTDLQADVFIRGDLHVANNVYVTELASLDKIKNNYFEGLLINASSATISTSVITNYIETQRAKTDLLEVETSISSNGYISIVGNITASVGNFYAMNIANDITIQGLVSAKSITATNQINTPYLNASTEVYSNRLLSPIGNITSVTSTTTTSNSFFGDIITTANVVSQHVDTKHLKANTVDIEYFSSGHFAANVIQANTVNTVTTISDVVQWKIYDTRPDGTNLPEGTMILFHDASDNITLEILHKSKFSPYNKQWKTVYLSNIVPL